MRIRYSVRGLLALVTILCVVLAAYVNAGRRVRDEADLNADLSAANVRCDIRYENEDKGAGPLSVMLGLAPPDSRICCATFYLCEDDGRQRALLPRLPKLPYLDALTLDYTTRAHRTVPDSPEPAFAEKFDPSRERVASDGLRALRPMSDLHSLEIFAAKLPASFFRQDLFPELAMLDLALCDCADDTMTDIARFPRLEWLSVRETLVTDQGIAAIGGLRNLQILDCSDTFVTEESLDTICSFGDLNILKLGNLSMNGRKLSRLAANTRLESLDVSWTDSWNRGSRRREHRERVIVPPERFDLSGLAGVGSLQELDVSGRRLAGQDALKSLHNLRILNLADTNADDETMHKIEGLRDLESLALTMTHLSDAGLRSCAALPRLRVLCLYGTQITDGVIETLCGMKQLGYLDVGDTKLSEEACLKLASQPNIAVFWRHDDIQDAVVAAARQTNPRLNDYIWRWVEARTERFQDWEPLAE